MREQGEFFYIIPHERIRAVAGALIMIAKKFGMSIDEVIYFDEKNGVPNEISLEDKATLEQLQLINELDEEEKTILLKLIETFVSKKRFKDYLQKNITTL